jgi:hypothetical protein
MTVSAPKWGTLVQGTPILFGGDATAYGLKTDTVYYVATPPVAHSNGTYTFQVSEQWKQELSSDSVPVQGTGNPQHIVTLLSPDGAGALVYGMVKPVTQLGSSQLDAGQLALNADGKSVTLWFGPNPPTNGPVSNWIPTPSTSYYSNIYSGTSVSTNFQLTLRMYFPRPGNHPPSILPCAPPECTQVLHESYLPPVVELVP